MVIEDVGSYTERGNTWLLRRLKISQDNGSQLATFQPLQIIEILASHSDFVDHSPCQGFPFTVNWAWVPVVKRDLN